MNARQRRKLSRSLSRINTGWTGKYDPSVKAVIWSDTVAEHDRLIRQENAISRTSLHIAYSKGKTVYQEPGLGLMVTNVEYRVVKRSPTGTWPVKLDKRIP